MERRFGLLIGLLLVFTMSIVIYGDEPEQVDLRLHLRTGMSFTQRVSIDQTIKQQVQDQTNEMHQTMHFDYIHEVLNVDELENADVRMTYKSIYIKQQDAGETFEFDSERPDQGMPVSIQGLASLIGTQLTVRISTKGEILQIQGLDPMLNQIAKKLKISTGPRMEALKKMYNSRNMTNALGQLIGPYPKYPVRVGDIWSMNSESHQNFPLVTDTFYKLKERNGRQVLIAVSSLIKSPPNAEPVEVGSLRLTYAISGHCSGFMIMGERTGLVLREEIDQEFNGTVKAEGLQGSSTTTWPISVQTNMIREIIK